MRPSLRLTMNVSHRSTKSVMMLVSAPGRSAAIVCPLVVVHPPAKEYQVVGRFQYEEALGTVREWLSPYRYRLILGKRDNMQRQPFVNAESHKPAIHEVEHTKAILRVGVGVYVSDHPLRKGEQKISTSMDITSKLHSPGRLPDLTSQLGLPTIP